MLIYLGLCALLTSLVASLLAGEMGILVTAHLVFALAAMPLIFGAIAHFVPVLTRSAAAPRAIHLAPLLLQLAAALVVLHFAGLAGVGALHAAAALTMLTGAGFCAWILARARRALGTPHPGWRWYLAALAVLCGGVALVPAMVAWPEARPALRLIHLHLNTLGFIGLAAIGTLPVLLPTVLGSPDVDAAARLRRDLPRLLAAVLALALGSAYWRPLALVGAAGLAVVVGALGRAWLRRYGWRAIFADGAALALFSALSGLLLLLAIGAAHAYGVTSGHDAVAAFICAFLLPLVSGALSQLVPVWAYPGRRTAQRDRLRADLVRWGALRSLLFVVGGVLLAFAFSLGWVLAVAAIALMVLPLLRHVLSRIV